MLEYKLSVMAVNLSTTVSCLLYSWWPITSTVREGHCLLAPSYYHWFSPSSLICRGCIDPPLHFISFIHSIEFSYLEVEIPRSQITGISPTHRTPLKFPSTMRLVDSQMCSAWESGSRFHTLGFELPTNFAFLLLSQLALPFPGPSSNVWMNWKTYNDIESKFLDHLAHCWIRPSS